MKSRSLPGRCAAGWYEGGGTEEFVFSSWLSVVIFTVLRECRQRAASSVSVSYGQTVRMEGTKRDAKIQHGMTEFFCMHVNVNHGLGHGSAR